METLAGESRRLLAVDLPVASWAKEEGIADAEIGNACSRNPIARWRRRWRPTAPS